ncbi:hypothetical protein [Clostridium sp. ZBS18]|uniref:hypothetical protein n=1 Tax=Clostridium sp. ZBS18 TaxID=2949967 RepID=UPI00207A06BB|nr:hypothetical protein [Clostridium sp. ZBS18]
MPRCNSRRCGFLGNTCMGGLSDCYCATRLTPKQCEKKMKELSLKDVKKLWEVIKNIK